MGYLNLVQANRVVGKVVKLLPEELSTLKSWLVEELNTSSSFLSRLYFAEYDFSQLATKTYVNGTLVAPIDTTIPIPTLPGFTLSLAQGESEYTEIKLELELDIGEPNLVLSLYDFVFTLKLPGDYLKAVDENGNIKIESRVAIEFAGSFHLNERFEIDISGFDSISLPKCVIGDTGIIVEATNIIFDLGGKSLDLGEVSIILPNDFPYIPDLFISNAAITESGISGRVSSQWELNYKKDDDDNYVLTGKVVGKLFDCFVFGIKNVTIILEDNIPTTFSIEGLLVIPVLDNAPLKAFIGLGSNGVVEVSLKGVGTEGLWKLTKDELFDLQVNAVKLKHNSEATALTVSGDLEITSRSIREYFPKIALQGFSIIYKPNDDDWGFQIEGGTVEVNKSIDLFGVARADIKEIGIGDRDGTRVIEFSGGVALEGIPAAGWVYGLRVPLEKNPKIGLDGIGLAMVVPNTLMFKGEAIYVDEAGTSYFQGGISLTVIPTSLGIAASIKVGRNPTCRFGFISAEVVFPQPGVPIGSLPLYLTSVAGLTGVNVQPDADTVLDLVPLFHRPPKGLTDASKWRDSCGSHAIGFGVGISAANPTLINLSALLAFTYPELLLFIEGKAFILEAPKPGKEPPFHSLIAYDIDDSTALIRIDADYEFIKGVLAAQGGMEAYYGPPPVPDPNRPNEIVQYFALGKTKEHFKDISEDERIRATVLQLFNARSFLYMDPDIWDLDAEIGFPRKSYSFSFATVFFEAFMKGRGTVNWGPNQFNGNLQLAGNVGFRVLRKGFDLSLGAQVTGMTPDWFVDAKLWFGVKFKVLWKKYEFGGTIPFHWEKRIVPPVPELLKHIHIKSLIEDTAVTPYVTSISNDVPDMSVVPEVEPDIAPVLSFLFRTKDRTGSPFGQDVNIITPHRSGDHTFIGELREVRMSRMKISCWKDNVDCDTNGAEVGWEDFEVGLPEGGFMAFANQQNSKPILYGAWQSTPDVEGLPGATELYLFARTPFDYNRPVHLSAEHAGVMMEQQVMLADGQVVSSASAELEEAVQSAAGSWLGDGTGNGLALGGAVKVPAYKSNLKSEEELSNLGRPLPYRAAQQAFNEELDYPHRGIDGFDESGNPIPADALERVECRNFLNTAAGYRAPDALIVMDGQGREPSSTTAGTVLIGGYAQAELASGGSRRVGPCEVVRDELFAYPFHYLEWHDESALDPVTDNVVSLADIKRSRLKILLRDRVKEVTIHYETIWPDRELPSCTEAVEHVQCSEDTRLRFSSAQRLPKGALRLREVFRKDYSTEDFWQDGERVRPSPDINDDNYGQLVITAASANAGFNELVFEVKAKVHIYSLCYKIDYSQDIEDTNDRLEGYMDTTWPRRDVNGDDGDGIGTPGPRGIDSIVFATPEGAVEPGYLYRLMVRTNQERIEKSPTGEMLKDYYEYFSVPRPPSNLTPYVVTAFPRGDKFPHYRSYEFYLRMGRNYVHKLIGDQHDRITFEIRKEGERVATLPFQDGNHSDLSSFLNNTDENRKGWGWGKAGDGHELTIEEKVWMDAYNRKLPVDRQIAPEDALPDDMIWAYPVNPVLLRADFSAPYPSNGALPGFLPSSSEDGVPITGRWNINAALLYHMPVTDEDGADDDSEPPPSFLLTETQFDEAYQSSFWVKPIAPAGDVKRGYVGLVLSAIGDNVNGLAQYLMVRIDLDAGRIALIQKQTSNEPFKATKIEKRFSLPASRWSRIHARVVSVDGKVAVTVESAGTQIFSLATDLISLSGRVGFVAHPKFRGQLDNLEVLSVSRLKLLPRPELTQHLVMRYQGADADQEMYRTPFKASRFLDLFDHLNAWDRNVFRSQIDVTGDEPALVQDINDWISINKTLVTSLAGLDSAERDLVLKLVNLEDVDTHRIALREVRFELDERFEALASHLGLELSPRPERIEFILAKNGMGLLIESPEPIDWMRLDAGPIWQANNTGSGSTSTTTSVPTQFLYSSDFTRAILLLQPTESSIRAFEPSATYVWTIKEYDTVPPHLMWLDGWVSHRRKTFDLTLEIPSG